MKRSMGWRRDCLLSLKWEKISLKGWRGRRKGNRRGNRRGNRWGQGHSEEIRRRTQMYRNRKIIFRIKGKIYNNAAAVMSDVWWKLQSSPQMSKSGRERQHLSWITVIVLFAVCECQRCFFTPGNNSQLLCVCVRASTEVIVRPLHVSEINLNLMAYFSRGKLACKLRGGEAARLSYTIHTWEKTTAPWGF